MGLDQYAYVGTRSSQRDDFFEVELSDDTSRRGSIAEPREIAYWRKHPNLQGWMEKLWLRKSGFAQNKSDQFNENSYPRDFNGVELELTWDDLEELENDIRSGKMEKLNTVGFFFGDASDRRYRTYDLEFIKKAKAELFLGLKVFYNSSW